MEIIINEFSESGKVKKLGRGVTLILGNGDKYRITETRKSIVVHLDRAKSIRGMIIKPMLSNQVELK